MSKDGIAHFGIIGAGGWGTALAVVAHRGGCGATLWTRNENVISVIKDKRVNEFYLPDVFLDPDISVTNKLEEVCKQADYLMLAVPAQQVRPLCISLSDQLDQHKPIIVVSKGIERGSLALMSEVISAILPANPVMVLSGPNFANEVAFGLPTATVIAGRSRTLAEKVIYALGGKYFRLYFVEDMIGVQVGGAVKNIIAIASGICMGKGLGENARSALITRGLAEISRLAAAKGAQAETVYGLSGAGDLMLTASSLQSRNTSLGYALGQRKNLAEILPVKTMGLSEGAASAESVYQLSRKLGVSMPICSVVYDLLEGMVDVDTAIDRLLSRPLALE